MLRQNSGISATVSTSGLQRENRKFVFICFIACLVTLHLVDTYAVNYFNADSSSATDFEDRSSLRHRVSFHEQHCGWFLGQLRNFEDKSGLEKQEWTSGSEISSQTYTLIVSTFDRDYELIKNIDHWLTCPHVNQVQIIWHNPAREPPELLKQMEEEYDCSDILTEENEKYAQHFNFERLRIRTQTENLLTNRFRTPEGGFETDGVFNIDDDAIIDCRLMTAAFQQWQQLGEHSLVGFEPRQIDWTKEDQGYTWYASCEAGSCEYNTLWPTKGAFLHRNLYQRYFEAEYVQARELVDNYLTGEDILMTYVHFSTYMRRTKQAPPILSIQATSDFQREFFNYHGRFSMFHKASLLPGYVMNLLYIDELGSLGVRSSWFRWHITSAIGEMAADLQKRVAGEEKLNESSKYSLPPMVQNWYFLEKDLSGRTSNTVCNSEELFTALRCTTYASLYPVSARDVVLMLIPFLILLTFAIVSCYVHARRIKAQNFELVRQRKVSGADISELYSSR